MLAIVAFMLFGFVATAQPSKVDKPTEWKPNTTVLVSPNQQYKLSYQSDGDLVVYDKSNKPIWSTKTAGKTPNKLVFQADGNLVLYGASNTLLWTSKSTSKGVKSLRLSDQGRLSVWDEKKVIWEADSDVTYYVGKVKTFDAAKGFGFIIPRDGGPNIFVHFTGLCEGPWLREGAEVRYKLAKGPRGMQAVDVRYLQ